MSVNDDIAHHARRLADHAPSMLAYWDAQLRCRFANRAYELWFGVDPDKLVGRTIDELLGPKLFAQNEPYIRAALRGEPQRFERIVPGPDGVQRHSLATYTPDVVDGRVLGFMAQVTDVTPLKRVQTELQATIAALQAEIDRRQNVEEHLVDSEQSLSVTLASIGAGFLATNREGRVTRMNETAQRLLGVAEAEALGCLLWDVFEREDRPPEMRQRNPIDVMLEQSITAEDVHDVVAIARDGRRVALQVRAGLTYSDDGGVRGLALVFRDLAQLKAAEARRDLAESRFRLVFEASSNALLMLDGQRRIVLLNRRAEQLLGYSRSELQDQAIEILVPDNVRGRHPDLVDGYLADPRSRAMGAGRELFARRKDGSEVPVEIALDPIETPGGRFTLASVVDITQRKRAEDELRRSNAELEQFAYVASHDLQEPLRMVASYTELLAQRYQGRLDEKADKYIYYAVDGAKRMQRLVADLLAYSRVGSQGKPLVPVPLGAVVQRTLALLRASIQEASATVEAEGLPLVMGDETQLTQLFQNLIGNAIKFRGTTPPHIVVRSTRQHDRWVIEVRDNGIGMDMKFADRIFQMFQRLHERGAYDGSGIGLAIVKRIVERHEGRIWVQSAPGQGASFFLTLRAVEPDAGNP